MAQYGRLKMNYIGTKCSQIEHGQREQSEFHAAHKLSGFTTNIDSILNLYFKTNTTKEIFDVLSSSKVGSMSEFLHKTFTVVVLGPLFQYNTTVICAYLASVDSVSSILHS